ncbi:MAG: PadR family transcriptional regulator [Candidatus Hodarchaeota archaeon]
MKPRRGAIYSMLNVLEKAKFVRSKKELEKGRLRKVYEITQKGKQLLQSYYDFIVEQKSKKLSLQEKQNEKEKLHQ